LKNPSRGEILERTATILNELKFYFPFKSTTLVVGKYQPLSSQTPKRAHKFKNREAYQNSGVFPVTELKGHSYGP